MNESNLIGRSNLAILWMINLANDFIWLRWSRAIKCKICRTCLITIIDGDRWKRIFALSRCIFHRGGAVRLFAVSYVPFTEWIFLSWPESKYKSWKAEPVHGDNTDMKVFTWFRNIPAVFPGHPSTIPMKTEYKSAKNFNVWIVKRDMIRVTPNH